MTSDAIAIGIDLGTTNSCVAVFKDGEVTVIPDEFNQRTVPSVVLIAKDGTRCVGREAKDKQYKNLRNTIYESKRLIGRKYDEQCIQDRMLHWPFRVVEADGSPKISVTLHTPNKTKKYFHPEEISGMILEKMKTVAETHLGHPITKAVITVPAYFNDNQRQATMDAAKIANLTVLKIMSEPTAAAFAYILRNRITTPCVTLVFDLGGGTFDVSVIKWDGSQFTVVAVNGDPDLGGADFDVLIYNEVINIIQKQFDDKVTFKPVQLRRIMENCIRVKEKLSDATSAEFELLALVEDLDFEYTFTREEFEKLISHLIKKLVVIVKSTLSDAKMSIENIDTIVLVGGSSRIPIIRKNLQELLKKNVTLAVNVDEAVACGAAYQAAVLILRQVPTLQEVAVVDITPFSLGIEAEHVNMDVLIKKNTALPAAFTKMYTTVLDYQTEIRITVYQGEDQLTANNVKLGYFDLTGIRPAPARVPRIYVTFELNTNGVLHVTATDTASNETRRVQIVTRTGRISERDFIRIRTENEEYLRKQQFLSEVTCEKNALLKFCFDTKRALRSSVNFETSEKQKNFISGIDEVIQFLENLSLSDETALQEICARRDVLQKQLNNQL